VAGTDFYYALSSKSATTLSYTAATKLYVAYYSATGCADADFVGQDQLTIGSACAALTSDSSKYGKIAFSWPTFTVNDYCTSTCSSCDGSALTPTAASDCKTGTTYWYAISATAYSATSGSILSFAAVALCALIALLF